MDQFLLKCSPINFKIFLFTILFVFILLGGVASPQMSFYVSPPLLEIEQIAGGTRNFTIEISNTGQEKIQVKTRFSDLSFSSEGKIELIPEGTTPYSLTSWITTKIEEFIALNPGEIKKIPLQVRVPRGERGGRYGVIVFEALPFTMPHGKVAMGIRSGTLVFLTIPRTEEIKGTIEEISSIDSKEFKVVFRNTGNIHYETEGSLIIKSEDGKVLSRIRFPEDKPALLLPQGKREFLIPWDKRGDLLPDGKYIIEARMSALVSSRALNLDRKEVTIEIIKSQNNSETMENNGPEM